MPTGDLILVGRDGREIRTKNDSQQTIVNLSNSKDVIFAIGPAGSGKTYVAIALAVAALQDRRAKKIILTRPAVEAGENLGFLPGSLEDKIDPYMRPLKDALNDMLPPDTLKSYLDPERNIIEIAPLAYMRGRTLQNAFIILDEAQNCTYTQLKMMLTRLGQKSKIIITGDPSQIDLPHRNQSCLNYVEQILSSVNGIAFAHMSPRDVLRHKLVSEIVRAYTGWEQKDDEEEDLI